MTSDMLPMMLTKAEAERITTKIELRLSVIVENSEAIAENTDTVIELILEAKAAAAHTALGYSSWPAYVASRFSGSLVRLEKAERLPVVAMLAETGMSTRAIGEVVGASKSTVASDIAGVQNRTPDVSGLDGKTYVRNGRPTARGMQEIADAVPPLRPKPRRRPLSDAYRDAVYDFTKAVEKMSRLHMDDRFAANASVLKDRFGGGLAYSHGSLTALCHDLELDIAMPRSICRDCGKEHVPGHSRWGGGDDGR